MNGRAAAGQTCRRRRSGSAAGVEEAREGKKQKDDEAEERKQAGGSRQEKEACGERSRQKNEAEGRRTRQKDSRRKQAEGRRGRRTTRQNDATVTSPQRLALPPLPPPLPPPPPPPLPLPLAPLALSSVCALAHSPSHVVLKPPALLIRALCSTMCYEVPCRKCGKKTWAGCGQHKDAVIAAIPKDQRCACAEPEPDAGGCTVS